MDAYQIKWSEYRNEVRFRDLVNGSTVSGKPYPAPFKLMADGWSGLRVAHPTRRVHAHYLMHDAASARDSAKGPIQGQPSHLQSFLRNAFPHRAYWFETDNPAYVAWSAKIDEIKAAAALPTDEFRAFVADCELDLGFDLPNSQLPEYARHAEDVESLAYFFMQRVSDSSGPVELRPDDIFRGLGWADRFELRFRHEFPVDRQLYQPIEDTLTALNDTVGRFRRGYVALIGPPGSGKSTTLTQALRYREGVRVIRYYAVDLRGILTHRGCGQNPGLLWR
ncbi:hypothetical protein SB783_31415 [Paraburkholderia sp. SIMBA_009]